MTDNEIVMILRGQQGDADFNFYDGGDDPALITAATLQAAADLIESLQGQLTEVTQLALEVTGKYETSVKMHQITNSALSSSQARERAAVDELCDCCKRYARTVTLKTDCLNCQWRGPQDGEEQK